MVPQQISPSGPAGDTRVVPSTVVESSEEVADYRTHFAFGKNWQDFGSRVTPRNIDESVQALARLVGGEVVAGARFLDIGCGSGLHSLAALRLGARSVQAIDLDPNSVEATRRMLARHYVGDNYAVTVHSAVELTPEAFGLFDVVYSWGVLHHTGAMWPAIERAAAAVAPGGHLVIALYRKTPLCGSWKWEKRLYTRSGPVLQGVLAGVYGFIKILRELLRGRNPIWRIATHHRKRGMRWWNDIKDWVGGHPYESASAEDVEQFLASRGFEHVRSFKVKQESGVFGSGNAEYVYRRRTDAGQAAHG